jgi:hypothetical protein
MLPPVDAREVGAFVLIVAMFLAIFALGAHADEASIGGGSGFGANGRGQGAESPVVGETPAAGPSSLADRALAWVRHRPDAAFRFDAKIAARRGWPGEDWVRAELVPAALEATQVGGWPDAEVCLALAWRESRWRPGEVGRFVMRHGRIVPGRGGEVGVAQVKPVNCRRYAPGENCADTRVNLGIAATILRERFTACDSRPRWALRAYATNGTCAPPRYGDRMVSNWAEQLRREETR